MLGLSRSTSGPKEISRTARRAKETRFADGRVLDANKSCGAQKLSAHPAPDALMVGGGRVARGSGCEQPPVIRSSPRGPRRQPHDS